MTHAGPAPRTTLASGDGIGVDLSAGFRAIKESLPLTILVTVLAALAATGLLWLRDPVYKSEAVVLVATPSRNEQTADQLAVQSRAFGGVVNDDSAKRGIEESTGLEVSTAGLTPNVKVISSESAPGTLTISTRAHSPEAAKKLGDAVIEQMRSRAASVRDDSLADFEANYQAQIDQIEARQKAVLAVDPMADITEFQTRLYQLRAAADEPRLNHVAISQLSQETDSSKSAALRPILTGTVLGVLIGLITLVTLVLVKLSRTRTVNQVWLRRVDARAGVTVDATRDPEAENPGRSFPPKTDAIVAAIRRSGSNVVLITEEGTSLVDAPMPCLPSEFVRKLTQPWWSDLDLDDVELGVIVIHEGAPVTALVEKNLDVFDSLGIPVRVVVFAAKTEG
ncbi:Chain length determinant protein [Corynebacterium capitovis DSM 44611]|uniref:Wzz/FepE/Etk N-terminal domain-containing protein n=1 Tax=Corynebacterium capitovis TaxID=131081 RepID=UPI00037F127B|nr:Wzz/FepE/Etk N-terminal domain-containing protein [Corynebacterium capitovis]WKD57209.1 Chain length determinant protein [Corynebacterium capitovis DSM 44611]